MIRKLLFTPLLLMGIALLISCSPARVSPTSTPQANLPNPASVYCEENGGKVDLRQDATGAVQGICVFRDGSECDEWAYFRGQCKPGDSIKSEEIKIASATNPPPVGNQGQIVFYSNRDGGYDHIYLLDIASGALTALTQGDNIAFSGPFSPDGTRLLFTGFGPTHSYVGVMNADGSNQIEIHHGNRNDESFPAWSPDGREIAFTLGHLGNNEIYRINENGSNLLRLTDEPKDDFAPAWSPDGTKIVFVSDRDNPTGIYSLYIMNADGSGTKRLTKDNSSDYSPDWSPDGTKIVYRSIRNFQADIYVINVDGSGEVDLTNNPAEDYAPRWSPDGSKIAFQTKRDGNWEIYVMNADGSNPVNLTNNSADDQLPFWRP